MPRIPRYFAKQRPAGSAGVVPISPELGGAESRAIAEGIGQVARSVQGAMAEHAEREERMQAMRRASAESAIGYDLNKMAIELENAERQNRGVDAIGSSTRYLNNMNSALEQYRRENRRKYDYLNDDEYNLIIDGYRNKSLSSYHGLALYERAELDVAVENARQLRLAQHIDRIENGADPAAELLEYQSSIDGMGDTRGWDADTREMYKREGGARIYDGYLRWMINADPNSAVEMLSEDGGIRPELEAHLGPERVGQYRDAANEASIQYHRKQEFGRLREENDWYDSVFEKMRQGEPLLSIDADEDGAPDPDNVARRRRFIAALQGEKEAELDSDVFMDFMDRFLFSGQGMGERDVLELRREIYESYGSGLDQGAVDSLIRIADHTLDSMKRNGGRQARIDDTFGHPVARRLLEPVMIAFVDNGVRSVDYGSERERQLAGLMKRMTTIFVENPGQPQVWREEWQDLEPLFTELKEDINRPVRDGFIYENGEVKRAR